MPTAFNTAEIKARLSELINQVSLRSERLIVLRRGKPVAALVSIEDLHRLEALDTVAVDESTQTTHPVMRAYGGWADRDDLDDLLTELYANRQAAEGRDVEL